MLFDFFKEWETVRHLRYNQLIVVLEDLQSATNYCVRAIIVEKNGQKITHDLNEPCFKTLSCIPRGTYMKMNSNIL